MLAVNATVIIFAYYIYIDYYLQEALDHHHSFHGEQGDIWNLLIILLRLFQTSKIDSVL